ncbi:hypothetical protein SGRA_4053 [Saprospira grandis str. Lewin]|uniref:Uncharacterized protein n=1 Tax=Saprospira grandis (strain Lewin) TaxID=984262 RepID=H6L796_SAPGL|nr:hypothetical protein SGRA_4053 [Saprospira grandis str. Lewin]
MANYFGPRSGAKPRWPSDVKGWPEGPDQGALRRRAEQTCEP